MMFKRRLACAAAASAVLFMGPMAPTAASAASQNASPACGLAPAQRQANHSLAWQDFEFGSAGGQPMGLAGAGCYAEAATASRDYLTHGPLLDTRQQAITTFHMGRNLAFSGREDEAAVAVAAARRSDQAATGLDWNTYVQGVYAFLVKDAGDLAASLAKLAGSPGEGNQTNAANLRQLQTCFDRSYLAAMSDEACKSGATEH